MTRPSAQRKGSDGKKQRKGSGEAGTCGVSAIRRVQLAEDVAAAVFFLALVLIFRIDLRDHFTLPKLLVLQAGALVFGALFLIRIRQGESRSLPRACAVLAIGLPLWWILSTLTAVHRPSALWGNYGRYQGLWSHLVLMGLFLCFASRRPDLTRVRRTLRLFVLALLPVALYAVAQFFGFDLVPWLKGQNRSAATIGQPVTMAALLAMGVPPLLVFCLGSRGKHRAGWIALLALILAGLLTGVSRGPLVGLVCALIVFIFMAPAEIPKPGRRRILAVVFALLVVVSSAAVFFGGIYRDTARLFSRAEVTQRLIFFKSALQVILDDPLTGVGFGNFSIVYPLFRPVEDNLAGKDALPTVVHNGYLDMAAGNGLPALLLYGGLVGTVLVRLVRSRRIGTERGERLIIAAITATLSGYLVQDLTGWFDLGLTPFFWILLGLGVCVSAATEAGGRDPFFRTASALLVLPLVGIIPLLAHTRDLLAADRMFFEAGLRDQGTEWPHISALLTKGLARAGGDFHYSEAAAVVHLERFNRAGDPKIYRSAALLFERTTVENPHNPYAYLNRIKLEAVAVRRGVVKEEGPAVRAAIERVTAMDRNNASVYAGIAELRVACREYAAAVPLLERAASLRPLGARDLCLLADAYRNLGRFDEAEKRFREASALAASEATPDNWITAAYGLTMTLSAQRKFEAALRVVEDVLVRYPERDYSHVVEAAVYQAMGDQEKSAASLATYRALNKGKPSIR